jgi:hypothetical protein
MLLYIECLLISSPYPTMSIRLVREVHDIPNISLNLQHSIKSENIRPRVVNTGLLSSLSHNIPV